MTPDLATRVVEGLKAAKVSFLSFLPESRLNDIIPLLQKDEYFTFVRATHEGSAVNLAAGASLVGRNAGVYMESTGLMLSLYNLQCVAINAGLPILLLVSHVGSPADQANSITFSGFGSKTESLLQAMNICYEVIETGDRLEGRIADMMRAAQSLKQPACLLFTGEFTTFQGEWT